MTFPAWLEHLPTELVIEICDYLVNDEDKISLSKASKYFLSVCHLLMRRRLVLDSNIKPCYPTYSDLDDEGWDHHHPAAWNESGSGILENNWKVKEVSSSFLTVYGVRNLHYKHLSCRCLITNEAILKKLGIAPPLRFVSVLLRKSGVVIEEAKGYKNMLNTLLSIYKTFNTAIEARYERVGDSTVYNFAPNVKFANAVGYCGIHPVDRVSFTIDHRNKSIVHVGQLSAGSECSESEFLQYAFQLKEDMTAPEQQMFRKYKAIIRLGCSKNGLKTENILFYLTNFVSFYEHVSLIHLLGVFEDTFYRRLLGLNETLYAGAFKHFCFIEKFQMEMSVKHVKENITCGQLYKQSAFHSSRIGVRHPFLNVL